MGEKFTPGPWAYRPAEGDDWGIVRAPVTEQGQWAGGIICQARDPEALDQLTLARHREAKTDPWEANARLIAAAPCMAAEMRKFCERVEAGEIRSKRTYTAFKALLARIEGNAERAQFCFDAALRAHMTAEGADQ
jgi:hypothetical protein